MGEKLLRLMKSEGLTSSRLAEILGTGASNISHIISGRSKPGSPCETDIAGNTDTVDAVDPHRIASGDFRNMTSSTVQRIIIVYSDRTFESFTPKQE